MSVRRWRIWEPLEDQDLSDPLPDTTWPYGESVLTTYVQRVESIVMVQSTVLTATIIYEEL